MTIETHENQKNFRNILDSLSYPGQVNKIKNIRKYRGNLYNTTIDFALTLIDAEITFNVVGDEKVSIEEIIIRTNSKEDEISNADFIFVPLKEKDKILETIKSMKIGTLLNPNKSATCIIEVEEIKTERVLELRGPGIKDVNYLSISDSENWIEYLKEINSNFPLGIDVFVIDKNGNLVGIPRTTKIEIVGDL